MFVKYGKEYAQLCRLTGKDDLAANALKEVDTMYAAILKDGWDGEWFLRAYDAKLRRSALTSARRDRSTSSRRASVYSPVSVLTRGLQKKHSILSKKA